MSKTLTSLCFQSNFIHVLMFFRWFASATRGKIAQFYEENIPNDTKLLLANALCFNSNWNNNFPTESTQQ